MFKLDPPSLHVKKDARPGASAKLVKKKVGIESFKP